MPGSRKPEVFFFKPITHFDYSMIAVIIIMVVGLEEVRLIALTSSS